jgi:hypothetical protein
MMFDTSSPARRAGGADAGLVLIDKLVPLHLENERRVLAPLNDTDQRQLDRLRAKLLTGRDGAA